MLGRCFYKRRKKNPGSRGDEDAEDHRNSDAYEDTGVEGNEVKTLAGVDDTTWSDSGGEKGSKNDHATAGPAADECDGSECEVVSPNAAPDTTPTAARKPAETGSGGWISKRTNVSQETSSTGICGSARRQERSRGGADTPRPDILEVAGGTTIASAVRKSKACKAPKRGKPGGGGRGC